MATGGVTPLQPLHLKRGSKMTEKEALEKIKELCKPGQTIGLSQAIDIICDCYNLAKETVKGN